jgi:DNA (cytosine-5)-methyltransferase 1
MEQLKILDLFSGLGGFSLGLERTGKFKTVAFCEIDKYCTLLLQKHWKGVKIYEDVRKINKEQFDTDGIEYPDIITGGFPCQPFSVAGKQKGTGDDRHLWPEMFRIIKTFKPKFVIGENVKGLINIQDGVVFETVCTDLESEGYEVQAFNIPAAGVGAPHRRERIWILATNVANSISDNEREQITRGDEEEKRIQEEYRQDNSTTRQSSRTSAIRNGDRGYEDMANTESERTRSNNEGVRQGISGINRGQGTIGTKEDMANSNTRFSNGTNEEIFSRGQTSNISSTGGGDKNVENSRCTLQQGTVFQGENENEIRKGNADQSQRSSSSSEYDVANSSSEQSHSNDNGQEQREISQQEQIELGGGSSGTLWPSNWEFEPNVGRVANGIPGRVHRLKGLGNSIVPKIAEEIGKAIIGAYNGSR